MKNLLLAFLLALLVVLSSMTLRRSVAGVDKSSSSRPNLVAIGGSPLPPIPPP